MTIKQLEKKAKKMRIDSLNLTEMAKKGHLGGTFSCVELLAALYYGKFLKFDPHNPNWEGRDRFILSKGHACTALYSIFLDLGVIDERVAG